MTPYQGATVLHLLREDASGNQQTCFGRKKKKYVRNRLVGPGGRTDADETPAQAVIREAREEWRIVVRPRDLTLVAIVCIHFPGQEHPNLRIHIFTTRQWLGLPKGTPEMGPPRWYPLQHLPRGRMPKGDILWLPKALVGHHQFVTIERGAAYQLLSLQTRALTPSDLT